MTSFGTKGTEKNFVSTMYNQISDKKSGDGLALSEWNDLSSALAGNSGLTLSINPADKVGIGTETPSSKLTVKSTKYGIVSLGR